jgi:pyrophosphatase PpaX
MAILFDLDGTLIDSIELIITSARHAFAELERPWPGDAEWLSGVGTLLRSMFRRYARDDQECDALVAAYRAYQYPNHDRLTRCYDGVADVVRELHARGYDVAIVTSKSEALAYRALALFELARCVDTVVGCDASPRHKPDPEPVRIALQRLDCAPADAIFVGDSIHDMQAGKAAGVRTAAALWGPFDRSVLEPASPTYYLHAPADVLALTGD